MDLHSKGRTLPLLYLLAVASLLVFRSYGVEDGDDVWWTVCEIGRAGHWRLMDVHGVRVLKDGVAATGKYTTWYIVDL